MVVEIQITKARVADPASRPLQPVAYHSAPIPAPALWPALCRPCRSPPSVSPPDAAPDALPRRPLPSQLTALLDLNTPLLAVPHPPSSRARPTIHSPRLHLIPITHPPTLSCASDPISLSTTARPLHPRRTHNPTRSYPRLPYHQQATVYTFGVLLPGETRRRSLLRHRTRHNCVRSKVGGRQHTDTHRVTSG